LLTVIGILIYKYFRAADLGNLEALIKMAIAYLYNEGCKYILLLLVYCDKKCINKFEKEIDFSNQ
jgi:hypothetical protein